MENQKRGTPGDGMRVLIAEDSALQAALLRKLFEGAGYQAVVARDGREALSKLYEGELPAVVISDIDMPEMDGYELCRAIKQQARSRHIPVILLTHLRDPRNVIVGLQAGADNYVTKPYDGERLLERVESLRRSPALYRDNGPERPLEVSMAGETFSIEAGRGQILNLLLSTFESAVWQNRLLRQTNDQLQVMHREMAEKNEQLRQSMETQNRFVGMAAHDMRNPLSVMLGYSHLLVDEMVGPLHGDQLKFVSSILAATESLLQLVNDMLEISAIEAGNLRLELVETDLGAVVRHAVEMNGFLARNKGIAMQVETDPLPPMRIDPGKMDQVLNNLLSNAAKFSHCGTSVMVELRRKEDGSVRLSVTDQGQGIPLHEQADLFQPFQRTSVQGTAGERSTGLGLAIVKRIVEGHGATITVQSQPGHGSTFTVTFPPV
jgi:signal transduction histidine kinase